MTPDPATVNEKDHVSSVIEMMKKDLYGSLPVVNEEGNLVGVITDRDIALRIDPHQPATKQLVRDLMSKKLVPIDHRDTLDDAWRRMRSNKIRRLLVTDSGRLAGIISRSEVRARIIRELADYSTELIEHENVKSRKH